MRKTTMLLTLIGAIGMTQTGYAEEPGEVLPAGTMLTAVVAGVKSQDVVDAEIRQPKEVHDVWDRIATAFAGCHVTGTSAPTTVGRSSIAFNTLTCQDGKEVIPIEGYAASSPDHVLGIEGSPTVGMPITIIITKTVGL
ncbi:hypothetical protein A9R05_42820 (plasmid) [Burkholderia sp. KK1]|nr:hypothetical protein [Burkholderia sp. M701]AQH05753.1 hypothetical protein A9R05_42820 [Burkholderia sp. KK1]